MKLFHFNIFLFLLAVGVIHSQNKSKKLQNSEVIIFNKNTAESFSIKELQMLKEVYGNELQKEILNVMLCINRPLVTAPKLPKMYCHYHIKKFKLFSDLHEI